MVPDGRNVTGWPRLLRKVIWLTRVAASAAPFCWASRGVTGHMTANEAVTV